MNFEKPVGGAELKESQRGGKFNALVRAGMIAGLTMISMKDVESHTVNHEEGRDAQSVSYAKETRRVSPDQLAKMHMRRAEMIEFLPSANTVWAIEQLISASSVEVDGERVILDDVDGVVPSGSVTEALSRAEEDMYDAVENARDMSRISIKTHATLHRFSKLLKRTEQVLRGEAERAFAYDHGTQYEEGRLSSVEEIDVYGERVTLHTLDARYFGNASKEKCSIYIQPGFATTAETYKRMAVSFSMEGCSVTVADIQKVNIDLRDKTKTFSDLPQLPQAYAVVAQEMIPRVAEHFGEKIHVIAYSLGSIGAAEAIAKSPQGVRSFVMLNPTGLYESHGYGRALELTGNVLTKHNAQVARESQQSESSRRVHKDITGEVKRRFDGEFSGGLEVSFFKLGSSLDATRVDLARPLREISVPSWIIAGSEDAFSPLGELTRAAENTGAELQVLNGWSHSSMKYRVGATVETLLRVIEGR